MAVAIQPVKFQAPVEVSGTGTTGSLTYITKAGYTGALNYAIRGLQAAAKTVRTLGTDASCNFDTANPDAMVAAGKANLSTFTTPAGANYVRFQTFASDASASAHDLDMFAYRAAPGSSSFALVATSGGPDQNEVINSTSAGGLTAGAQWKIYVHACNVDAPGGNYSLFAWGLTTASSNPFTTVPPNRTVVAGDSISTTFGLDGPPGGQPLPRSRRPERRHVHAEPDGDRSQHPLVAPPATEHQTKGPAQAGPSSFSASSHPRGMQTALAWLSHPP